MQRSLWVALAIAPMWFTAINAPGQETLGKQAPSFAGSKPGDTWDKNGLNMAFCWCPPGKFTMGSPPGEPDREKVEDRVEVSLSRGFWLGKYEVTQPQWEKLMGTTLKEQRDKASPKYPLKGEGADFPMYYVNRAEAVSFCVELREQERRAGRLPADWEYTLPTEAQWEYACRAGTKTATAFGDKLSSREANFNGDVPYNGADKGPYLGRTRQVGSYKANAWGLFDMHGNVWEWCRDWYQEKLPGGVDPEVFTEASVRVLRGGCWGVDGWYCRSAYRYAYKPGIRFSDFGFRVAAVQTSK